MRSLAVGLRDAGTDVVVAALLPPTGKHPFVEGLRSDGIEVHEIREHPRDYPAQVREVAGLIRARGFGLVHTHVYTADAIGRFASKREGVPWVATVHGLPFGSVRNLMSIAVGTFLLRSADAVICVAEPVVDHLRRKGIRADRLHLIPNGYAPVERLSRAEARATLDLGHDTPTVGWVGRMSHEKGGDLLLEALARPETADLTAVIIGDGDQRQTLEARAAGLGFDPSRVRFVGRIDDAARHMEAFDTVVISSRTEGTPMVLLESMAAGIPVASFAVGGIPDMVDERSAYLVPAGDVHGLATAMNEAVRGSDRDQRASAAAEVFARRYSVEEYVRQTSELYAEVIRRGRAG